MYAKDKETADKAAVAAFIRIDEINEAASDYLPESELSRFNKHETGEPFPISEDFARLLAASLETSRITDGAFDITATYGVQQWRRAKRHQKLPSAEETAKAITMTDWRALKFDPIAKTLTKLKPGLRLDMGAIGKGYAADAALAALKAHGISQALVAASGDLAIGDAPPGKEGWSVFLRTFEKPEQSDHLVRLTLKNCAVSTSGDLHQFLEIKDKRYSHVINPKTGLGLTNRIACTIIAPNCTTSDSFDNAGCVLGVERGLKIFTEQNVQARFVTLEEDGTLKVSTTAGFPH